MIGSHIELRDLLDGKLLLVLLPDDQVDGAVGALAELFLELKCLDGQFLLRLVHLRVQPLPNDLIVLYLLVLVRLHYALRVFHGEDLAHGHQCEGLLRARAFGPAISSAVPAISRLRGGQEHLALVISSETVHFCFAFQIVVVIFLIATTF